MTSPPINKGVGFPNSFIHHHHHRIERGIFTDSKTFFLLNQWQPKSTLCKLLSSTTLYILFLMYFESWSVSLFILHKPLFSFLFFFLKFRCGDFDNLYNSCFDSCFICIWVFCLVWYWIGVVLYIIWLSIKWVYWKFSWIYFGSTFGIF